MPRGPAAVEGPAPDRPTARKGQSPKAFSSCARGCAAGWSLSPSESARRRAALDDHLLEDVVEASFRPLTSSTGSLPRGHVRCASWPARRRPPGALLRTRPGRLVPGLVGQYLAAVLAGPARRGPGSSGRPPRRRTRAAARAPRGICRCRETERAGARRDPIPGRAAAHRRVRAGGGCRAGASCRWTDLLDAVDAACPVTQRGLPGGPPAAPSPSPDWRASTGSRPRWPRWTAGEPLAALFDDTQPAWDRFFTRRPHRPHRAGRAPASATAPRCAGPSARPPRRRRSRPAACRARRPLRRGGPRHRLPGSVRGGSAGGSPSAWAGARRRGQGLVRTGRGRGGRVPCGLPRVAGGLHQGRSLGGACRRQQQRARQEKCARERDRRTGAGQAGQQGAPDRVPAGRRSKLPADCPGRQGARAAWSAGVRRRRGAAVHRRPANADGRDQPELDRHHQD